MFIGVLRLVFQIPGAASLKDRRRVVKSFKDRVRARFPVSIAEVGDLERWQVATLGVAVVSGEAARCQEVLSAVSRAGKGIQGGIEQALGRGSRGRGGDEPDEEG
jgi:uncharacterized protein YlxP (DUF503 family)